MMNFGHITPSPVERELLQRVGVEIAALRADQMDYFYRILKSWGVDDNWYGIHGDRACRRALKIVRRNLP